MKNSNDQGLQAMERSSEVELVDLSGNPNILGSFGDIEKLLRRREDKLLRRREDKDKIADNDKIEEDKDKIGDKSKSDDERRPILGHLVNGIKIDVDLGDNGQLIVKGSNNLLLKDVLQESLRWNHNNPKAVIILDLKPTEDAKKSLQSVIDSEMRGVDVAREKDIIFNTSDQLDLNRLVNRNKRLLIISTLLEKKEKDENNVLYDDDPSKIIGGDLANKISKDLKGIKLEFKTYYEAFLEDRINSTLLYGSVISKNLANSAYDLVTAYKMPDRLKSLYYLYKPDLKRNVVKPGVPAVAESAKNLTTEGMVKLVELVESKESGKSILESAKNLAESVKPIVNPIVEYIHNAIILDDGRPSNLMIYAASVMSGVMRSKKFNDMHGLTKNAYTRQLSNLIIGTMMPKFGKGQDLYNATLKATKKSTAAVLDEVSKNHRLDLRSKGQLALYCAASVSMEVCLNYCIRGNVVELMLGVDEKSEIYKRIAANTIALICIEGIKGGIYKLSGDLARNFGIREYKDLSPRPRTQRDSDTDTNTTFLGAIRRGMISGADTASFKIAELKKDFGEFCEKIKRDYILEEFKIALEEFKNSTNSKDLTDKDLYEGARGIMLDKGLVDEISHMEEMGYVEHKGANLADNKGDQEIIGDANPRIVSLESDGEKKTVTKRRSGNNISVDKSIDKDSDSLGAMDLDSFSTGISREQSYVHKLDAEKSKVSEGMDDDWNVVTAKKRSGKEAIDHNLDKKSHISPESNRRNWKEDLEKEHNKKHKNQSFVEGLASNSNGKPKNR